MSRHRPYVSRRDWHRIGDLMPDRSQCPGCASWQRREWADRSGWCGDCIDAGNQPRLFGVRDVLDRPPWREEP